MNTASRFGVLIALPFVAIVCIAQQLDHRTSAPIAQTIVEKQQPPSSEYHIDPQNPKIVRFRGITYVGVH